MFVATHIPRVPQGFDIPGGDKSQHFLAYAALAILLAVRMSFAAPFAARHALRVLGIIALYGALDEVTQIPVGRHADVWDWVADLSGGTVGMALFLGVQRIRRRKSAPLGSIEPVGSAKTG
jgi:VanZ family protein